MNPTRRSRRVVILGGGFGGAYAAQRLERLLPRLDAEALLLDRHNYMLFTPLLIEAGTGSLEPRHAVVPVRAFLRRTEFHMAEVLDVDLREQLVEYRLSGNDGVEVARYDHLVIALGSVSRLPDVPGLREYGLEIKGLADAVQLRDRAIQMIELAEAIEDDAHRRELLHFVVVGGNFTGVEVAGEFDMFLREASRQYRRVRRSDCRVTLIELADRILGALDRDLSEYAARTLTRRGVELRLRTTVNEVHHDHVVLSTGEVIRARTTIWCAGIEPAPLVRRMDLPHDERGYILCERDLRVRGHDNVWAIGDCAVNIDKDGRAYPATAQHATRQGSVVAENVAAALTGRPTQPCDITSRGSIAALGCRTGVARVFNIKLAGFWAWFIWRTVYLFKMPRLSRKVRVALDWTIDLLFSRDYVQLGVHRGRASASAAEGHRDSPVGHVREREHTSTSR